MNREVILQILSYNFSEFGKTFGFDNLLTDADHKLYTEVYVYGKGKRGLSFSVDWRECTLNMNAVRMNNGKPPISDETYFTGIDGRWCRKRILDIYNAEFPNYTGNDCWSEDFLRFCYEVQIKLIQDNPGVLLDVFSSIDWQANDETVSAKDVQFQRERQAKNNEVILKEIKQAKGIWQITKK